MSSLLVKGSPRKILKKVAICFVLMYNNKTEAKRIVQYMKQTPFC